MSVSVPGSGADARGCAVLVKHAFPVLDPSRPPLEWRLGPEGEAQAGRLAAALERFAPFRLIASTEPKAVRTAEIVAGIHGLPMATVVGLREIDRPRLPIMSRQAHAELNRGLFTRFESPVVGNESAREARDRFTAAVAEQLRAGSAENLVVVAHGTVIALLVAAYNPVDAFDLWTRLQCPSFVVLDRGTLALVETVEKVA